MIGIGQFLKLRKEVRKIKPRISIGTAVLMIAVALGTDVVQIFIVLFLDEFIIGEIINWTIDVAMTFISWLWCRLKGVKTGNDPKRLTAAFVSSILKAIPLFDMIPSWTGKFIINISTSWAEDIASQAGDALGNAIPGGKNLLKAAKGAGAVPNSKNSEQKGGEGSEQKEVDGIQAPENNQQRNGLDASQLREDELKTERLQQEQEARVRTTGWSGQEDYYGDKQKKAS